MYQIIPHSFSDTFAVVCDTDGIGYTVAFDTFDRETELDLFQPFPELIVREVILIRHNEGTGAIEKKAIENIATGICAVVKRHPHIAFYYMCEENESHSLGRLFKSWFQNHKNENEHIILYESYFELDGTKFSGGLLLGQEFENGKKIGNYFENIQKLLE